MSTLPAELEATACTQSSFAIMTHQKPVGLVLMLVLCSFAAADPTTVVTPRNMSKPAIGFIILPGAQIGADQYLNLGIKIQEDSEYSVWLATVGGWVDNLVNPLQLKSFVNDAVTKMKNAKLPDSAPIYIAAHSLGGVFLDMYARGKSPVAAGIVLYSSYISKSVKLKDYPMPVLTISGDQDGMCRMTRILKDFGQLSEYTPKTPVVIVPGVNHSLIASGKMPKLVETNDLIADCSEEKAHALLSNVTNAFLTLNGPPTSMSARQKANATLQSYFNENKLVAYTYQQALQLDTGSFPSWTELSAIMFADIINDTISLNFVGAPQSAASVYSSTPEIVKVDNQTANMSVPYHNDMPFNPLDVSLYQQSPQQQHIKTVSKEKIRSLFPNATFANRARWCNDTNYSTIPITLLSIPYQYWDRYSAKGMQVKFASDRVMSSESSWKSASVSWTYANNTATVASPLYHNKDYMMCKVVTISKIVEWVLVDAFKKTHS